MEKLKKLIEEGVLTDLIKAEVAISVFKNIAANSSPINASDDSIKYSFGYIQQLSFNEFILSIARLYDRKTPRNSNRCIESVIRFLETNKEIMPAVREKYQLELHMREFQMPEYLINLINNNDTTLFPSKLALYFEQRLINLREQIKNIKTRRDKTLAHNEPTEAVGIKIDDTELFLTFGWKFVVVIGWAYLNTAYGTFNNFHLKRDSQRQGVYMKKVIQKLV